MTQLYASDSTAEYLGYSVATLRNSRNTGLLAGVEAPPHIKLGKSVRYDKAALDEWLAQFKTITSSENAKKTKDAQARTAMSKNKTTVTQLDAGNPKHQEGFNHG